MENGGEAAYSTALRMLGRRALSVKELQDRLARRGFCPDDVAWACERLQSQRLVDDAVYARAYIHDRLAFHPVGKPGLRLELLRRGVPAEIVTEVLAEVDEETEEELVRRLVKSRHRTASESPEEERRTWTWLLRRGFSPGVIRRVLGTACSEAQPGSDG